MALRAESPIQALEDIRKLPRVILYKDGVYQQRWKPYSFPTEDSYNKWQKRALILYVISAIVVGGSAMAFFTRVISFPEALLIAVSLGYFPVMFFIECLRARNRDGRLYRMSVLIKKNGGRLYEKAEAHLIPDDVVGMATKEGLTMAAAWRRYLELTQAEVAERIGISHLDYARLEASRKLRKAKRKKVAQALGISPEQLEEK
uniref:helix-turn-helix domain-containing protein n=1 Tax=Halomonas sp. TaxID=1486246 RepID=UPI002608B67B|nr:hypothetical protein [Halomonas sp.]